jgi:hypothetical protein
VTVIAAFPGRAAAAQAGVRPSLSKLTHFSRAGRILGAYSTKGSPAHNLCGTTSFASAWRSDRAADSRVSPDVHTVHEYHDGSKALRARGRLVIAKKSGTTVVELHPAPLGGGGGCRGAGDGEWGRNRACA